MGIRKMAVLVESTRGVDAWVTVGFASYNAHRRIFRYDWSVTLQTVGGEVISPEARHPQVLVGEGFFDGLPDGGFVPVEALAGLLTTLRKCGEAYKAELEGRPSPFTDILPIGVMAWAADLTPDLADAVQELRQPWLEHR